MPVVGAEYRQRTADEWLAFLESELRSEWGEDIDLTESSAFETFAEALATDGAENLESAIGEVFDAAYLESASGQNLDRLVEIIGIQRQSAIHATGTIRFSNNNTVQQSHVIQSGTTVQTDSDEPIEYETLNGRSLHLYDDFEDGSLDTSYGGDTGDASVVDGSASADPSPRTGSYELKVNAVNDSIVYQTGSDVTIGKTFDFRCYIPDTDSTANGGVGNVFCFDDSNNYYRIEIEDANNHRIVEVDGGTASTLNNTTPTVPSDTWLRNEVRYSPENDGTITSKLYEDDGSGGWDLVDEVEVQDEATITRGGFGFQNITGNEAVYWDQTGDRSLLADARAVEGGIEGNIGAGTLTVLPSPISGVDGVTNPYPMGNIEHYLTDLTSFTLGENEETDGQLRERARVSEGAGGNATANAIIAAIRDVKGVQSVTVYENDSDSTDPEGRPGTSYEAVVYQGDDRDVADSLFDTAAFTAQDVGGYVGTSVTETVEAINGQTFDQTFSRPNTLDVDISLDLVVDDTYVGDDAVREDVVRYIGGTMPDGTVRIGTSVGEDVYADQVRDAIVGPSDNGVIGVSSATYTPTTTTDSNDLTIVDVGANEVAETNGEDGSISITTTTV